MTTGNHKNIILTTSQVKQKIKRIACEIHENNFKEHCLILAGVEGRGFRLTQLIEKELKMLTSIDIKTMKIRKKSSALQQLGEATVDGLIAKIKKKCIILIDDVLNTGKTLTFCIKPLLSVEVKKIEIAVLVNRSYSLFPLQPKYTGLELSTTLNEHVEVVLTKQPVVYLY